MIIIELGPLVSPSQRILNHLAFQSFDFDIRRKAGMTHTPIKARSYEKQFTSVKQIALGLKVTFAI